MDQEGYWNIELDEQILQDLYAWIDQIPLSRPKRRIERDFSDGGLSFVLDYFFLIGFVIIGDFLILSNGCRNGEILFPNLGRTSQLRSC